MWAVYTYFHAARINHQLWVINFFLCARRRSFHLHNTTMNFTSHILPTGHQRQWSYCVTFPSSIFIPFPHSFFSTITRGDILENVSFSFYFQGDLRMESKRFKRIVKFSLSSTTSRKPRLTQIKWRRYQHVCEGYDSLAGSKPRNLNTRKMWQKQRHQPCVVQPFDDIQLGKLHYVIEERNAKGKGQSIEKKLGYSYKFVSFCYTSYNVSVSEWKWILLNYSYENLNWLLCVRGGESDQFELDRWTKKLREY